MANVATEEAKKNAFDFDPGLPVPNPTVPMWQVPLHSLANVASETLPDTADVVVIGSGMTGCSVTKTLLEGDPMLRISVLEARGLASGASSRNGGHIISPSFGDFPKLVAGWGREMAAKIANFTLENCEKTFEMVDALNEPELKERSEIRRTEKVLVLNDESIVNEAKETLKVWNEAMPECHRDKYRFIGGKVAEEKYGLKNVAGACVGSAAAVWPYRLWSGIWELLLKRHKDRLTIETHTPVTEVQRDDASDDARFPYRVTTPRGVVRAARVVYCTNGFTPHLIPRLRGKIFPWRGTMSCQDLGPAFPNAGAARSWSFVSESRVDPELGVPNAGLYYLTQNPTSGRMFLGGENERLENIISSDDGRLNPNSAKKIGHVLPALFQNVESAPRVEKVWSGIMGFTRDGSPLVGRLPEAVTGRPEGGEWIAAGFNGFGTGYCFRCGQAVGEMMLGKTVDWLPDVFYVTKDRLEDSLVSGSFHGGLLP
ncbi:uncharacterized protein PV09_02945 [Verruconis gallopava]|uniref:FAD dependent oxidoreductase domain-containing protein n=1 Tax=Verruconis gallopava TaxID=253628 RepID=A0A0D1Z0N1_9PEZI|nr:uncharacterized protein PV09_02945 [Verruconis gallopava]KIW06512.1 hypothetical protein PV09_02945 [Verruconis gallopava]